MNKKTFLKKQISEIDEENLSEESSIEESKTKHKNTI